MSDMSPTIKAIEQRYMRKQAVAEPFRVGDTVRVHTIIKEGDKERVQIFEGVVIARKRGGTRASFTVRKISYGVGVERVFPLHSARIEKVELTQKGKVRQARLYYLRELQGKAARIKGERTQTPSAAVEPPEAVLPSEEPPAEEPPAEEPPTP